MSRIPAILEALNTGKTVDIITMTRVVRVTPATFAKWTKAGNQLFLASSNGHDYMASGKRFVCIDYCKVSVAP